MPVYPIHLGATPLPAVLVDAIGKTRATANLNPRIGTTNNTRVKTDAASVFHSGLPVPVAAVETAFTVTTHNIASGNEAKFLFHMSRAGALVIAKGADAAGVGASVDPALPADTIAVLRVTIRATGLLFTATTDALNAAHLAVTYEDLTIGLVTN